MKINASCVFDLDSTKALIRLGMFQKHDPKKRMIFWGIIYTVLAIVLVLQDVVIGLNGELISYLGILLFAELLVCYSYFLVPRIRYKAMANMKGTVNQYCFLDDSLEVTSNNGSYGGKAELQYTMLVKSMETSKYFFLYQTKNQIYIVDKSTISGGTAEDIRNKLISVLDNKHIICKY